MSYTDPYRHSTGSAAGTPTPELSREEVVRTMLWVVVVISVVANMAASYSGAGTWVHLICGAVTLLSGCTLALRALRSRR